MRGAPPGSGRPPSSAPTRASAPSPTPSIRRSSSATTTGCSGAGRGSPIRSSPGRPSATGISRSGGRSSRGSGAPPMPEALSAARPDLYEQTRRSLEREPKELSPVWLYDERGSRLYEGITRLAGYYLPRAEAEILRSHAAEIARRTKARTLVELGSGSARNTRFLLDALETLERFVPVDVSAEMLRATAGKVAAAYPRIAVEEIVGDFQRGLGTLPGRSPRLIALLGSTIGNF